MASDSNILLLCYYDPHGIATVIETIDALRHGLAGRVTVINLFTDHFPCVQPALKPSVNLDAFTAILIHNTLSYSIDTLRSLDRVTLRKLKDYRGIKILMKQDENHRFRELALTIGEVGFDVIFTCLPPEAVEKIYPRAVVGTPLFERMLTGYVTPALRQWTAPSDPRPILIGYRGSTQPLRFGRLAYEKRSIGDDVARLLASSGLPLNISSRWEDRLGNTQWYGFLSSCTATLGAESGASIFDLDGDMDTRCAAIEQALGPVREDAAYAEAYLAQLADLENNIAYAQLSPRHFEAAATGTIQLLFSGHYSGVFTAGKHYFELARDYSNLPEAIAFLQNESAVQTMARAARHDIIDNPAYHIETFVAQVQASLTQCAAARPHIAVRTPSAWAFARAHIVALTQLHPTRLLKYLLPQGVLRWLRSLPWFRQGLKG